MPNDDGSDSRKTIDRFVWMAKEDYFSPIHQASFDEPFSSIRDVFVDNLNSSITVGSVPFTLANASINQQRFHQLYTAERIRSLKPDPPHSDGADDEQAFVRALDLMKLEQANPQNAKDHVNRILKFLESGIRQESFSKAADELLRQVLVMIWGAFEVLATDLAIAMVNESPALADNPQTAKRYKLSNISIDALKLYDYNVSQNMGRIIFENQRLDSLPLIQESLSLLLKDDSEIEKSLKSQTLWNLSQKRHLIVHRRGIADKQYLSKTSDATAIGTHIRTNSSEIDKYLIEVRDTGFLLLKAASRACDESKRNLKS